MATHTSMVDLMGLPMLQFVRLYVAIARVMEKRRNAN